LISEQWVLGLSAFSLVTFVLSLLTLPWLVAQIPANYFLHEHREASPWKQRHPVIRFLILAGKNLLGLVLLIGGFIMLFLPGQGLLTLAMGLLLMDYPGKYHMERWFIRHPPILKGLNWLRQRRNVPPLLVDQT
jgi:hypothetical protein